LEYKKENSSIIIKYAVELQTGTIFQKKKEYLVFVNETCLC